MVKAKTTTPSKPGRGWRLALWFALALAGLLLAAYFVVTSNTFFKGFVLPRVSESLHASVTVSEASIRPFSQVVLHDLKVQPAGEEPVFTARRVLARYSLLQMLRGRIVVEEAELDTPVFRVTRRPDGTSNLDPLLGKPDQEPEPARSPSRVDLGKLAVTQGALSFIATDPDGSRIVVELADLNVAVSNVKNGATAKLALSSGLKLNTGPATNLSKLTAILKADFNARLDPDLQLDQLQGEAAASITRASGAFADAALINAKMGADLNLTEIKKLALHFTRDTATLGVISVSGPYDPRTQEGQVKIEVTGVGHEVLSLVGGPYGVQFGRTELAANLEVELQQQADLIRSSGNVSVNQFSLVRDSLTNAPTPVIDLDLTYDATIDRPKQVATLRTLAIQGAQGDRPLIASALSEPMVLNWNKAAEALGNSTFSLILTNLDLADWRAFVGPQIRTGEISGVVTAAVRQGGNQIGFELSGQLVGLAAQIASNAVDQTDIDLVARGAVSNFSLVDLALLNAAVRHQTRPVVSLAGAGRYNFRSQNATLQAEVLAQLPQAARWLHPPELDLSAGSAVFRTHFTQTNQSAGTTNPARLAQNVFAELHLDRLSGQVGSNRLDQFDADVRLDTAVAENQIDLRHLRLSLPPTARATNQLVATGQMQLAPSNTITGALKVTADSLDLTPYADLLLGPAPGSNAPAARPAQPAEPGDRPAAPAEEPEPFESPLRQFVIDARIGRAHWGEVTITNATATMRIDRGSVVVQPVALALNGGPVRAAVGMDLGVSGYTYQFELDARRVPLTPLVNTFQPAYKGKVGGTLDGVAQLSGAGLTPTNRSQNLKGHFDIGTTNLNLALADLNVPVLKQVVNVILNLPELIRVLPSGLSGLDKVLGWSGTATTGRKTGWLDELGKSPVDVITGRGQIQGDRIDVQQVLLRTPAFQTDLHGAILLAPNPANSTLDLPVSVQLRRSLAEAIKIVPANTPTNIAYIGLPEFLAVGGTLEKPKENLIQKGLLELGSRAAQSLAPQAAPLLDRLTDALKGSGATTNAPGDSQKSTNQPRLNLEDLFRRK